MNKLIAITTTVALTTGLFQLNEATASAATTKYVKVSGGIDLNVRKSASTASQKLGVLKNNSKITVIRIKNGWAKIQFKGKTAYVSSKYLTSTKPKVLTTSTIKTSAKVTTTTYYVKTGSSIALNVRKSKSTASKKIGAIKNGQKVEVVTYAKGWSKIKYGTGYGYVSSAYIYKKNLKTSQVGEKIQGEYYAVPGLAINLNVRKSASTASQKLGEIKQNTKLKVISHTGKWIKIKYGTGYGYISDEYVAKKVTVDFSRNQAKTYTVYDIESQGTVKTFSQKNEKSIAKWGNVNTGFTHTESIKSNSYAFFNYETGYGYSINLPIFVGATAGSLKNGYSKITAVNQTVKVKAGTFKQVVIQKVYNSKNKNTKIVYYAPNAGVILAKENGIKVFELISVK
ncbi:MAG: SH3 domain-containing protein [Kurthia sp.]|nr:SH3 domain-containing protein [Candidatus Kurthia equi]